MARGRRARYERLTGNTIEVVASGPKPQVVEAFRAGGIDLITVHACDAMVNLVADGLARDPQPWARNDLVIVGPADDPAGIRGKKDALVAIGKIIETKVPLLVHASMGVADGVLLRSRRGGTPEARSRRDDPVRPGQPARRARQERRPRALSTR